jgi:hypothetical protein
MFGNRLKRGLIARAYRVDPVVATTTGVIPLSNPVNSRIVECNVNLEGRRYSRGVESIESRLRDLIEEISEFICGVFREKKVIPRG